MQDLHMNIWIPFAVIILGLLSFDLFFSKKHIKQSFMVKLSIMNLFAGIAFSGWIAITLGASSCFEYLTGFLVEKSLSFDNLFVISLIFKEFKIQEDDQHYVLFWGILGVLVLRGIFIALGSQILYHFEMILIIFALILIVSGIKLITQNHEDFSIQDNFIVRFMKKIGYDDSHLSQKKFFIHKDGKRYATPLLMSLISVEFADLVFAIDSIPAIFSITKDPIIVYTSNIFAILGLRSLYFVLTLMIKRFYYLKYSVSLILIFIGLKVLIPYLFQTPHLPPVVSLITTSSILLLGIFWSWHKKQ